MTARLARFVNRRRTAVKMWGTGVDPGTAALWGPASENHTRPHTIGISPDYLQRRLFCNLGDLPGSSKLVSLHCSRRRNIYSMLNERERIIYHTPLRQKPKKSDEERETDI